MRLENRLKEVGRFVEKGPRQMPLRKEATVCPPYFPGRINNTGKERIRGLGKKVGCMGACNFLRRQARLTPHARRCVHHCICMCIARSPITGDVFGAFCFNNLIRKYFLSRVAVEKRSIVHKNVMARIWRKKWKEIKCTPLTAKQLDVNDKIQAKTNKLKV